MVRCGEVCDQTSRDEVNMPKKQKRHSTNKCLKNTGVVEGWGVRVKGSPHTWFSSAFVCMCGYVTVSSFLIVVGKGLNKSDRLSNFIPLHSFRLHLSVPFLLSTEMRFPCHLGQKNTWRKTIVRAKYKK